MGRKEFIDRVIDEITEGGAIPASPRIERINSIVTNALLYWWEHDEDSYEYQYFVIEDSTFHTPLFKAKRQIAMPTDVHAVIRVKNMQRGFANDIPSVDKDFRLNTWNLQMGVSGDSPLLLTAITNNSYNSYLEKFVVEDLQYEFSSFSHLLTIKGRSAIKRVILECTVKLPEESIFDNELFFRYVVGKCKISFASIVGFSAQKLIGGYNINYSEIKSEGREIVNDVLKEQQDRRVGDFCTFFD